MPAVATGSHIDAIPNAGRYDGVVGVLGGLEAIRALKRAGHRPRRSIELVRVHRGRADALRHRLSRQPVAERIAVAGARGGVARSRRTLARRLARRARVVDGESRRACGCARDHYAAFVELHIEQGPSLEQLGIPIGVVDAIAGPSSYRVTLTGEGGHAGAVLMPDRHDAGLAGAEIALAVERAALDSAAPTRSARPACSASRPNAINSIPCDRDARDRFPGHAARHAHRGVGAASKRRSPRSARGAASRGRSRRSTRTRPRTCAPALVDLVVDVAAALGHRVERLVSRAYHDSLFMAQLCPTTMIFIPCRGGVSHRPDEYSSPEAIAAGATVLAHALARLSE